MVRKIILPKWIKGIVLPFVILAVLVTAAFLFGMPLTANNSKVKTDIISWYVIEGNQEIPRQLLVITKRNTAADMMLDTGEAYGDDLKVYSNFKIADQTPVLLGEPDEVFDLSELKPMRVQAGDIDGGGVVEIAVCVYKTAKFHPVLAKRPFFYNIKDGELSSVWLGSRLARPFVDYILSDVDQDGIDEIISIERLENENQVIAIYDWKGFGFEVKTVSEEWQGKAIFLSHTNRKQEKIQIRIAGENYQISLIQGEIQKSKY